jgi:polysaccharide biosynthesis/export protein
VLGEMTAAGQYPCVSDMTAQKAVAIAGGYTPRSSQDSVDLTRNVDGKPVTGKVPLSFPIKPGDTITVEERYP